MNGLANFLAPLLSGVVGAVAVAALARLGTSATPDRAGWRRIAPSAMHWTALVGSAGFASLMLYVRLFVGSARADAETQMMWATLILVGFTVGSIVSLWQIFRIRRADVFWRGSMLCFSDSSGQERVRPMTEVAAMERRWTGTVEIWFNNGEVLKLDQYATGVPELWQRIVEINDGPATA